jgi:hypothetical protein
VLVPQSIPIPPLGHPFTFNITSYNCPLILQGNTTCHVTVTFAPNANDLAKPNMTAYLTVYSGTTSLVSAKLTGEVVDPNLNLSTTSYNFGPQPVGSPDTVAIATLTNEGPTTLTIHNLTLTGSSAFQIVGGTNACSKNGETIASGGSCKIYVQFTPTQHGATYNGSICINGNQENGPLNITLKGSGAAAP